MTQLFTVDPGVAMSTRQPFKRPEDRHFRSFRSRQMIPLNRNQIWVVQRGIVQLSTLHMNGDETLLGLVCPGSAFGLDWASVEPYQATTLTEVILVSYSRLEIEQSPEMAQELLVYMQRRLKQTEALLAMAGCRRVEDRLRHLLLLLKSEVGTPVATGMRLDVKLTHQLLASAIGTTRVTVTRLIGQFKEEGWLYLDDKRHIVLPHESTV
jgi:CRP-like cAMP-binding protein